MTDLKTGVQYLKKKLKISKNKTKYIKYDFEGK